MMNWEEHLVSIQQFDSKSIDTLFYKSSSQVVSGKKIAILFYEPSTRTSASFQSAAFDLGVNVIMINGVNYSSVTKGEDLSDTIRTIGAYVDLIVLRHPDNDAALRAMKCSSVPIINAGCGTGEHPTQALLDLYTIRKEVDTSKPYTVTFFGDTINSRTVNSLVWLLGHDDNCTMHTPSPQSLKNWAGETDILYVTRLQKERGSKGDYTVTMSQLEALPKHAAVMHPFPRNHELPREFDTDPRAAYFRQITNGLTIRRRILEEMLAWR
tara:strand:- start:316 stop:1119 length:804 start_codon:yes stop_codon:yes gene_type:complete